MPSTTTEATVADLQVGDVVLGIETTTFKTPLTVTRRNTHVVYATGGAFWPLAMLGTRTAQVAR